MKTPLIIERPELQSPARKTLSSIITSLAWTLWIYLWLPLLSILAWGAGIQLMVVEIFLPEKTEDLKDLLRLVFYVIGASLVVIAWSQYNLHRYGNNNRRHRIANVDDATLARYYEITPALLNQLRHKRLLTLDYCSDHQPVIVDDNTDYSHHPEGDEIYIK